MQQVGGITVELELASMPNNGCDVIGARQLGCAKSGEMVRPYLVHPKPTRNKILVRSQ